MNESTHAIKEILDGGTKEQKIKTIENLSMSNDHKVIQLIISKLDDPDIEVRGESFSSLVLNKNNISKILIQNLNSEKKFIRGFSSLILANRNDTESITNIIQLTKDQSSMVRSCALGALGFLKAYQASKEIHSCFTDSNLEVKKSALKAAIDIGEKLSLDEMEKMFKEKDEELERLLVLAKQN